MKSDIIGLLNDLFSHGVKLWVQDGELHYKTPWKVLTNDYLERLRLYKKDIINILSGKDDIFTEYGLSSAQQALWFIYRLAPESPQYNVGVAFKISSDLDRLALRNSFQALVNRHPSLRTTFYQKQGDVFQRVHGYQQINFNEIDASKWDEDKLHHEVQKAHYRPFNLEKYPVFRTELFIRSNQDFVLLVSMHHIITDGWSLWLILQELRKLYGAEQRKEPVLLPEIEASYADNVQLESKMLKTPEGEKLWEYWKKELSGELPVLNLPTDYPRPPVQTYNGATVHFNLNEELTQKLKKLSQQKNATLYMTLLAAFHILLHRYTGQDDIIVSSPTTGRSGQEFTNTTGYFVNMISMRADFSKDLRFEEFLNNERNTVVEGFRHGQYPFPLIVKRLGMRRDTAYQPLAQASFAFQKPQSEDGIDVIALTSSGKQLDWEGMIISSFELRQQEGQFDIFLEIFEDGNSLSGSFKYNTDLFQNTTIKRMTEHFKMLVQGIVDEPSGRVSELPMLKKEERDKIIIDFNDTETDYPKNKCIHQLFENQVEQTPDAIAVVFEDKKMTYREVNERADMVAHRLRPLGAGPGVFVGICIERSLEMLVGLLGILKAGAAYIPMDPSFPAERIGYMIEDTEAPVILAHAQTLPLLSGVQTKIVTVNLADEEFAETKNNSVSKVSPEDLAYVMFTSGSTGRPKGVQVTHKNVVNFLNSMSKKPGFSSKDSLLAVTTISFDISVLELFLPLITGGTCVLASKNETLDGGLLKNSIEQNNITVMQATPATWRILESAGMKRYPSLKALCGGEPLPPDIAIFLIEKCQSLWNMYGPTETTIWSTIEEVKSGADITIGRPIDNTTIYILDKNLNPVPLGVSGALYIGGDGVTKGYLKRPELTEKNFIKNPFNNDPSDIIYNTGDLAQYLPDLKIECLGRADNQIKLRGFRIELGEIEAVLSEHPDAQNSAVTVKENSSGEKYLAGYIVEDEKGEKEPGKYRNWLKKSLPDYMIPSFFVFMDFLPLTPNGKIDRKSLPEPEISVLTDTTAIPQNKTEKIIADIWKQILNIEHVGINNNFFEIGGHSLLIVKVNSKLKEILKIDLPVAKMFQYPTIKLLSENISPIIPTDPKIIIPKTQKKEKDIKQINIKRETPGPVQDSGMNIAIIGMACRFPEAENIYKFWENIKQGRESIRFFTDQELVDSGIDPGLIQNPDYVKANGYLSDSDKFDASFFRISPRDAEFIDPQQRLFLQCAWEAIEDAGYDLTTYNSSIGIYGGSGLNRYMAFFEDNYSFNMFLGNSHDFLCTRVAYKLNLKGPAVGVQTACSTSIVAVHAAANSLLKMECDMALAGGVSLQIPQKQGYLYDKTLIFSHDGHCRAFDANASGTVIGSGAGIVVLKRLSDAIADKDNIYAVIKGVAINNDGSVKVGFTAPSVDGQAKVIVQAQKIGDIAPESISYIEAHGTGTRLGDPIEIEALTKAFRKGTKKTGFCALGSVKPNIGHLDTAAGVAGLIKTVMALKHKVIPPSINFQKPNPEIDFENSPFYVNTKPAEWKNKDNTLRKACISSLGVGGTNAHVILEEYESHAPIHFQSKKLPCIFLLSAKNKKRLKAYAQDMVEFLNMADSVSLIDVAYTLQVGRKAMEQRLAIIVESKDELISRLKDYCKEKTSKDLYTGNVKKDKANSQILIQGKAGQEFLRIVIEEKQLSQLAQLWVSGTKIDWLLLYHDKTPNRVSLPTYPFTKERYWVPESENIVLNQKSEIKNLKSLHPLIDSNESTLEEQRFKKIFVKQEFFLNDHIIKGRNILPGVALLEMAIAAGNFASKKNKVLKVRNVVWINRLDATDISKKVYINLYPDKSDVGYKIYSGAEETVYSQGKLVYEHQKGGSSKDEYVDIDAIKRKCPDKMMSEELYSWAKKRGLDLGESFKTLHEIFFNEKEALSILKLSSKYISDLEKFMLHPGLMDSAMNGFTCLFKDHVNSLHIPFSMEEMEVLDSLPEEFYAHGTINKPYENSMQSLNIHLLDKSGRIVVRIKNLIVRSIQRENKIDSTLYFRPIWENYYKSTDVERDKNADISDGYSDSVIMFDTDKNLYNEYVLKYGKEKIVLVKPGKEYLESSKDEKHKRIIYEINPENKEDYHALITSLYEKKAMPGKIIWMWSKAFSSDNSTDESLLFSVYSLLYFTQALMKKKPKDQIRLLYACLISPFNQAISGFAKSVRIENPKFVYQTIEFQDISDAKSVLENLSEEFHADHGAMEVRYEDGQRLIKRLEEFDIQKEAVKELLFKEKGTYLITGGMGGLGLIFAGYLAKNFKANLVLAGRAELTTNKESKISDLKKSGANAVYVKADTSEYNDVVSLIDKTKTKFKKLDGIIHAAGIIKDSLIFKKTKEEMNAVLTPKVHSSINIDKATKDEHLDFFVLFSSISGAMGNAGQCDYAYANSFMDNFAAMREELVKKGKRFGKTVSINWPLWKEGGMHIDEQTEKLLTKTIGVGSLITESGIRAFEKGLSAKNAQFGILTGNLQKIRQSLTMKRPFKKENKVTDRSIDENDLSDKVQKQIFQIASNILKLKQDMDPDADMSEYGFESITLTELINQINDKYDLELMPAVFFEYPTIGSFAKHLCEEHKDIITEHHKNTLKNGIAALPVEQEIETPMFKPRFQEPFKTVKSYAISEELIAVTGISGIMPQSSDLNEFWKHLVSGDDLITEIPQDRWNWREYFGDSAKKTGKTKIKWGGFMKDIDKFDASFFKISPREAENMDPQQRLMLQTVWQCIEDAGYKASALSGTKTGLFIGVSGMDYYDLLRRNNVPVEAHTTSGIAHSVIPNRISYILNLRGPSEAVDTACSSSLVAVHRAIMSIKTGECDAAIAGGVNAILVPEFFISFDKAGMLSPDGKCKTFDKSADGYVRGEGVGAVLLKPLSKAQHDKDLIYAVIKGSAVNHGGHVSSLTVPNPNAQAELLIDVYEKGNVDPVSVSYIETHGTGTKLGDPVEINGLKKAFKKLYENKGKSIKKAHCQLGTVKTNMGHLESAAGIAGMLKVILAMKYKTIPGIINFKEINPQIQLEGSPFYIVDKTKKWDPLEDEHGRLVRRAGISSFGFGGANAHVVIEEYVEQVVPRVHGLGTETNMPYIFVLSAKNQERLKAYAVKMEKFITSKNFNISDIAYTSQIGRESMEERIAMIVSSIEELQNKLKSFIAGHNNIENFYCGSVKQNKDTLAIFEADEEFGETIDKWIKLGKYSKFLSLWVKGLVFDWNKLYDKKTKPKRISLPTYPFGKERYWVPEGIPGNEKFLDPFLNRNTSDFSNIGHKEHSELMTFEECLMEEKLPAVSEIRVKTLICFLVKPENRKIITKALKKLAPETQVIFIYQTNTYRKESRNYYSVSKADSKTYHKAFADIIKDYGAVDAVLYMSAFENPEAALNYSGIVYIIQAMAAVELKYVRFLLGAQLTKGTERCYPESWIGFERSLGLVMPNMQFGVIYKETETTTKISIDEWVKILWQELQTHKIKSALYKENKRYVYRIRETKPEDSKSLIKQGGTYLITGGCGGLGALFADYFAKKYPVNLILTGRSSIDDKKRSVLKSVEDSGSRVIYIQADVCDFDSMRRGLTHAKERFGKIDGVIHGAGIENTQSILEKDIESFNKVLHPKVEGTLVLDKILNEESPDFICYFSSSSAILGDFGGCDYAIANRFLMSYANYKNELGTKEKNIVINWPLWKDGGMGSNSYDSTKMYLKSSGQRFLETEEGLELFDCLISQKNRQHLVLAGESLRIKRFLGLSESRPSPSVPQPVISAFVGKGRRKEMKGFTVSQCLEYDLKEQIGSLLKISPYQLDSDVNLADFGLDSIMLAQFAAVLTQFYGTEITPSVFFGNSTIEKLIQYFLKNHNEVIGKFYAESEMETSLPQTVSKPEIVSELTKHNKPEFLSKSLNETIPEPIAIIGMSGRFPGARNIDEMWQILVQGKEAIIEIPIQRFDSRKYYGGSGYGSEKMISNRCGILPGVSEFEPLFFEISPKEAEAMDPRQRILLQESWNALEDAGYGALHIKKNKMGIFAGVERSDYQMLPNSKKSITSDHEGILAARLAYFLNFEGPVMAINTACSSGLVAAHQACQSLRARECDTAIAASVNLMLTPSPFIAMSKAGMLSPLGRCFAFDKRADGMVPGEAVVSVVLKRLSDAERDKDSIYAVIKGSGINYDGKTNGITVPNGNAQVDLLKSVYDRFQINPEKIDYIVTHGTGTKLGDPVEINALYDAFKGYTDKLRFCALTSSKTNFGHTFAASGLVSLVSLVQALRHKTIPASLHCKEENDYINWKESPFYVNKTCKTWDKNTDKNRTGAVNAFGMSGTNAHVVIQSYWENEIKTDSLPYDFYLLTFSAKTRNALEQKIEDMLSFLQHRNIKIKDLSKISLTLSDGRHHFKHRNAIVIQDIDDAIYVLNQLKNKERSPKIFYGEVPREFTGQNTIRNYTEKLIKQARSVRDNKTKYREILYTLAEFYCHGYEIRLSGLYYHDKTRSISLPTYPFEKKHYCIPESQVLSKTRVSEIDKNTVSTHDYTGSNIKAITDAKQLHHAMVDYLIKKISSFLKVEPKDMEPDEGFEAYGLDSILITILTNNLEEQFGKLPSTLFFTYKNVRSLAGYFIKKHKEKAALLLSIKHDALIPEKQDDALISISTKAGPKDIIDYPPQSSNIAIIGLAGKYPMAKNIEEYWDNLKAGKDCIVEVPKDRWDCDKYPDMYCKWGGFLDDTDKFDPLFFNISPKDAKFMDPQERLFLEIVWACLEDSGYNQKRLEDPDAGDKRGNIGVFAGVTFNEYQLYSAAQWSKGNFIPASSQIFSVANRVSYFLNLRGPSLSVDTACSSSLYAVHLACESIIRGECAMALAGGVSLSLHPNKYIGLCQSKFASTDGRCRAFCEGGDGYVPGEGVGAVLLKPLENAVKEGDRIYAVIKSTAVNHDGKTQGYTVPNPVAQTELIKTVIEKSGINPRTISYLEAHGTGTSLGDPIEITGLSDAYAYYTDDKKYCSIGSVKSNIGHCEAAAGIAQVTKTLLQMKYKTLVPCVLHSGRLNPNIDFENSPFFVQTKLSKWDQPLISGKTFPRRAGMSSFGAGGVNVHLIMEEYQGEAQRKDRTEIKSQVVIPVSAKTEESLYAYVRDMKNFLEKAEHKPLIQDIAYTFQIGREPMSNRVVFVVQTLPELIEKLDKYIKNEFKGDSHPWLEDQEFDWNSLYPDEKPRRISLPTYHFAKRRCWIAEAKASDVVHASCSLANIYYAPIWKSSDIETSIEISGKKQTDNFSIFYSDKYKNFDYNKDSVPEKLVWMWNGKSDPASGIYSLLLFTRGIMTTRPKTPIRFIYAYHGMDSEIYTCFHRAMSGFMKTAMTENSKFIYKTIEFDDISDKKFVNKKLTQEFAADSTDIEIRYKDSQRQVKRFEELAVENNESKLPLKKNGTYIITGGMGGLGIIFANYLAAKCKADIVLSGRSELTSDKEAKISNLNDSGVTAVYIKADISKYDDAKNLIKETKSRFGKIDGIIHAAGLIKDSLILNKTEEEMKAVLDPKVYGAINLDSAAKDEQLNFFVLFSSLATLFPNAGQCDYAYANTFMDNFVIYRNRLAKQGKRFGKALAINWPLWKDGGMHVDKNMEKMFETLIGVHSLPSNEGLRAFEQGLLADAFQFAVFRGDVLKIKEIFEQRDVISESHVEFEDFAADHKVFDKICEIASNILDLGPDEMDSDTDMSDYGFDSVSLTDFMTRLSLEYRINIAPAIFFEHTSIGSLVKYLCSEHKAALGFYYKDEPKESNRGIKSPETSLERDHSRHFKEDVAIVGIAGVMPGSENLSDFWQHLENQDNLITKMPKDRCKFGEYSGNNFMGGFIKGIDEFDASFFNISPHEAKMMDPQQRIILQTVWQCIEDSGYKASDLSGTKTGLFIGVQPSEYLGLLEERGASPDSHMASGASLSMISNRVSYILNLHGTSESIDTACSSVLVAVNRAVMSIRTKECDMAIAGGVNLLLSPKNFVILSKAGMLSPDGRCKTFDKNANGYVRGEGAGVVLLKPLTKAQKDGDIIYAVIKGTAVNHGGHANSLTAPNPSAQAELLLTAYENANIDPASISYIETHGTGTKLGDPVEINGLKKAFKKLYDKQGKSIDEVHCGLGSVKTNIGHLEPAAGIAGILKVILSMKYKKLPASINLNEINPQIYLEGTPFYIVDKTKEWKPLKNENGKLVRRAGISSFGFGGSNAHIILEEYVEETGYRVQDLPLPLGTKCDEPVIFVLSAKNEERLKAYAIKLKNFLNVQFQIVDIAYTLQIGRQEMEHRLAIVANSAYELVSELENYIQGVKTKKIYTGNITTITKSGRVVKRKSRKLLTEADIKNKTITELALLWVLGAEINWHLLYKDRTQNRISLPTYPFAKTRFSIFDTVATRTLSKNEDPLKQSKVISPFGADQIEYTYKVSMESLPELKDTNGVLHVGYSHEMLARAIKARFGICSYTVKKMEFVRAMIAPDTGLMNIHLAIKDITKDEITFRFYTQNNKSQALDLNIRGVFSPKISFAFPDPEPIEKIQKRCSENYSGTIFYKKMKQRGYDFGPSVKYIEEIWRTDREALARFREPENLEKKKTSCLPFALEILENITQVFFPGLPDSMEREKYMVYQWEDFIINGTKNHQELWCHVRLDQSSLNKDSIQGSFHLFDKQRNSICFAKKNLMKRLSDEMLGVWREAIAPEKELNVAMVKKIEKASFEQKKEILADYLKKTISEILDMKMLDLDMGQPLRNLGMDSILTLKFKTKVLKQTGIDIPIEELLQGPATAELIENIINHLPEVLKNHDSIKTKKPSVKKDQRDIWFYNRRINPAAKVRLFCFPYGGGGASLYQDWQKKLPDYIEVCPVQLPGRENRIKESPIDNINDMTDMLEKIFMPNTDKPFAIYGHSMGALVAFRLAYCLWNKGAGPAHLFTGGYTSPSIPNTHLKKIMADSCSLGFESIPTLDNIKNLPVESPLFKILIETEEMKRAKKLVKGDTELLKLFMPMMIADLGVVKSYKHKKREKSFNIPITVFHGKDDHMVSEEESKAWKELTTGDFKFHVLTGDHLFLHENKSLDKLLNIIITELKM